MAEIYAAVKEGEDHLIAYFETALSCEAKNPTDKFLAGF